MIISIDRLECMAREMLRIVDSNAYSNVEIKLSDFDLKILPIADEIRIVLRRGGE
jgi:hypothetical protein